MDELLKSFNNYGFPMVVSAYLLIRIEAKLEYLSKSITDLTETINISLDEYRHGEA